MPILRNVATPNGITCSFHKADNGEFVFAQGVAVVRYLSWTTEDEHNAGASHVYVWPITVPLVNVPDVDAFASVQPGGPFESGTVVPDTSETLAAKKLRKWAAFKAIRDTIEFGKFAFDGSEFDCDTVSTGRIMGAFSLALAAKILGAPFEQHWTLADNTIRVLTADDMLGVGLALGTHVGTTHAIASQLRQAGELANTPEELEEITWP